MVPSDRSHTTSYVPFKVTTCLFHAVSEISRDINIQSTKNLVCHGKKIQDLSSTSIVYHRTNFINIGLADVEASRRAGGLIR